MDWTTFLEQTVVFNPEVPADFMAPWWFGDVRKARDARLAPIPARSIEQVHTALTRTGAVAVSHRLVAGTVPPWARTVELTGAPALAYSLNRRRAERSSDFVDLVPLVAAVSGTPPRPGRPGG
ncbi:hypothetical protein ACFFKU_16715 [Kineococcus gynurae]|uniref:Uncharacterized protein n=1 Tax=Kineococcus gynurae TaxID=452979 RepID=A0ABV5LPC3_9ACTN